MAEWNLSPGCCHGAEKGTESSISGAMEGGSGSLRASHPKLPNSRGFYIWETNMHPDPRAFVFTFHFLLVTVSQKRDILNLEY